MKSVVIYKLAKLISNDIDYIGLRPGEELNEDLISEAELPYTKIEKDYIYIYQNINKNKSSRLDKPISSDNSLEMDKNELLEIIEDVKSQLNNSLIY